VSARAQALAAPAAPPDAEDLASWFWSLIDAGFLAEAGFDAQRKVLFPPVGHPLPGWSQCQVTDCVVVIFATQRFCSGCKRRFTVAGLPEKEFSSIPRPADQPRRRMVQPCRVPGCRRPWIDAPRALCSAHHWQKSRVLRCSLEEFLARPDLEPLPSLGACAVAACHRDASVARSMLCHAHKRRQVIITAGSVLKRGRLLGLTRPGEPMHGLADDFALIRGDLPARPERSEAGRDLPPEVMRQLCARLDWLDGRVEREMRVGIELLIDTGRRPDEACELAYDCLACDNDGKPVLIYGNSKENRPQRQLPLHQATADLIRGQQARGPVPLPAHPCRGAQAPALGHPQPARAQGHQRRLAQREQPGLGRCHARDQAGRRDGLRQVEDLLLRLPP
jgi:hypothetical protein